MNQATKRQQLQQEFIDNFKEVLERSKTDPEILQDALFSLVNSYNYCQLKKHLTHYTKEKRARILVLKLPLLGPLTTVKMSAIKSQQIQNDLYGVKLMVLQGSSKVPNCTIRVIETRCTKKPGKEVYMLEITKYEIVRTA